MAKQEFKSTITLKEGLLVEAESRGFKVVMDEPAQLGGTNKGMNPVEMLLSSLGGCLSITMSAFSKAAHVDIKNLRVHVTGDLDPEGFLGTNDQVRKGFSQIRYEVEVETDASEEKVNKLLQMVEERCPVSDTLMGVEVVMNNIKITSGAHA